MKNDSNETLWLKEAIFVTGNKDYHVSNMTNGKSYQILGSTITDSGSILFQVMDDNNNIRIFSSSLFRDLEGNLEKKSKLFSAEQLKLCLDKIELISQEAINVKEILTQYTRKQE